MANINRTEIDERSVHDILETEKLLEIFFNTKKIKTLIIIPLINIFCLKLLLKNILLKIIIKKMIFNTNDVCLVRQQSIRPI